MKEQVSEQASPIITPQSGMSFWSLVAAGMGPWWALWLILILPQIPEGQTPAKPQGFPQLTSFENDKVQGFQRGKRCDTWSYTLIPATKPGEFTMENKGTGTDREDVQVIETDYTNFALLLSLRTTSSQTITRVSLLGRSWRLPHKTIDRFICLTRTQNLTKNNFIFPDVTDWLPDPNIC
ncbi:epididymal-specific lipocalin-12 isoform X3 [Peromyscus eremicus]|uniref:epididymal-specific lipocalin-12 isoform X3 n=1 Tax=Peromyscus eremicus TaxID=42410 RepID=UPI0027DE98F0|nr:epididymal-specific lipocalin-12 isoform X3 [Peromyscus eremicus]